MALLKTQDFYEKRFFIKFYNGVILKISACTIMPGFCKSGHKYDCKTYDKVFLCILISLIFVF